MRTHGQICVRTQILHICKICIRMQIWSCVHGFNRSNGEQVSQTGNDFIVEIKQSYKLLPDIQCNINNVGQYIYYIFHIWNSYNNMIYDI